MTGGSPSPLGNDPATAVVSKKQKQKQKQKQKRVPCGTTAASPEGHLLLARERGGPQVVLGDERIGARTVR
ncbi:hypothetical protein [Streptomyces tirandamycinicus]|uniref:Uncharacterized protein n=1 Tax=Streptomyces tirandamycinicus TaxID=2174846 RepID=A0A2S1SNZ1_9ACTN|nr:hypothetical protein [Streptomyces tirandamycinicus]AWI28067.1 hypothetical protein DDW44_04140 [Streptomyces tirandamycinicus]